MAHGWHHKLDKACGLPSILLQPIHRIILLVGLSLVILLPPLLYNYSLSPLVIVSPARWKLGIGDKCPIVKTAVAHAHYKLISSSFSPCSRREGRDGGREVGSRALFGTTTYTVYLG